MSDLRQCSKEFLIAFIELYKSLPCLWRIKSKEYSDRDKKSQAYEVLVEKYKEIDPAANREMVTKKIKSMRSVYRKEMAKVNKSIRSGAGEEDVYKPTLWYFHIMDFLNDQETQRPSRNTMDQLECSEETGQEADDDTNESDAEAVETSDGTPTLGHVRESSSCSTSRSQYSSLKRKLPPHEDKTIEVLTLVGNKLNSLKTDDPFDVFGKHVANKLRGLNSQQNSFAQKLINDVLFEAEMESLTRSFKVVDVGKPQYHFGSAPGNYGWQHEFPSQIGQPKHIQPHIGRQHNIPSQIGQYQHVPQQIGQYQHIPQQFGLQQFIPLQIGQQRNIPQQIREQQNILQQIGEQQNIPQQIGEQQQTPQVIPNPSLDTTRSTDANISLVDYITNFEVNN